MKSLTTYLMG